MFNFVHWQINIVLTKDGYWTLANVVIADPTHVDLFSWSCTIRRFVVSNAIQAKEWSYRNQHPID
jgi:hypothetical protein